MTYDLETLRLIWWALVGLVALGFASFEGISLGTLMLLPLTGDRGDNQASQIKSVAPVGLTNLAWLVAMITLLFAAWPIAYAVALASLQPLLLVILLVLLLRPLALYFADAIDHPGWQTYARKALVFSGWVPTVLLGLMLGNLLKGIPFHLESDMRIAYLGDAKGLFNLFSLLVAANCVALLLMHGASYQQLQAGGELRQQAHSIQWRAGVAFLVLFALAGLWITHLEGYHITSELLPNATSNPLAKFVKRGEGLWLDNYEHIPALIAIPSLAAIGVAVSLWLGRRGRFYLAMLASSTAVAMALLTVGVSMFPFLVPSNLSLNSSLTIWDSSASQLTLQTLLAVATFTLPVVFWGSRWVFRLSVAKSD